MRLAAALLLACAAFGLAFVLSQPGPAPSASGEFGVQVIGPGGDVIFNGTVQDSNATALSVLLRAAAVGGFDLDVRGTTCSSAYVVSIAGIGEEGVAGWVYQVARPGEGFGRAPAVGAACCNLRPGDTVRWSWSTEGALGPPCP